MKNTTKENDWDDFERGESENSISFAEIVHIVKKLLPYIIICGFIGVVLAWFYYKSQEPQYVINSKILIKDDQGKASGAMAGADMFKEMGLFSGASSVDNELEIITTYSILDKVVNDLQLNVKIKKNQFFNSKEKKTYQTPWDVKIISYKNNAFDDNLSYNYNLFTKDGKLWYINEDKKIFVSENKPTSFDFGILVFEKKSTQVTPDGEWSLEVQKPSQTVENLSEDITPSIPNKNTSIITLEMKSPNPARGKMVMNKLIDTYIREGVKDNNSINDSTLFFINDRLRDVEGELQDVEVAIQNFKQKNDLTNIDDQVKLLLDVYKENSQKSLDAEVQLNVITSLENHLRSGNTHVIPASLLTQDASLSGIINQYNLLVVQKEKLAKSATPENPLVKSLNSQLSSLRNELLGSISTTRRSYATVAGQLRSEANQNLSKVRQMPLQERQFLDISRQQAIKQELYLFLLKKREETELGKSSTLSNTRVIDYARVSDKPVEPKGAIILFAGMLLGAILPFLVYFIRQKSNLKLKTKKELNSHNKIPIIGEIGHQEGTAVFEVKNNPRSPLAEQFRILRTNLHFYQNKDKGTCLMLTSSMPGEGKTFISINLAATLAANKQVKVLLIGMDLRKPKLASELGLSNKKGFTNYAINDATLDEIIYDLDGFSNLKVMPSGPIPPNPSELLMSKECEEMFNLLRERFDFIVIDCPPTVVTDYQIISNYCDVSLYSVRVNYTNLKQVEMANEIYRTNKLPRMNLVINDFIPEKYDSYNSGYYSQYGYYETEEEVKKKWWEKFFKS